MLYRKSNVWWAKKGDLSSKEFFRSKAGARIGGQATSLLRPNGTIIEDIDEIMETATSFYKDLIAPQTSCSDPSFSMEVLTCIQPHFQGLIRAEYINP